jgi:hypothetical protein
MKLVDEFDIKAILFFRVNRMDEPPKKKVKVAHEDSKTSLVSLTNLPREILCTIFSNMDKKSVQNSTGTCKLWFELIRGNSNLSNHICLKTIELQEFDERIGDLELTSARWPVLKTITFFGDYPSFIADKIVQYSLKLLNSKDCPTLEKVIISVSYCLTRFSPQFPRLLSGTIKVIYKGVLTTKLSKDWYFVTKIVLTYCEKKMF